MKVRNYEKKILISIFIILLIILEIIFLIFLYNTKIYNYELLNGVVIKDDLVLLIVSEKENNLLNKNSYLYLNSKKIKYKVFEDRGFVLKRDNEKYKEVILEFKFNKKYKANDSMQIILKKDKKRIIEIFKIIWDGD